MKIKYYCDSVYKNSWSCDYPFEIKLTPENVDYKHFFLFSWQVFWLVNILLLYGMPFMLSLHPPYHKLPCLFVIPSDFFLPFFYHWQSYTPFIVFLMKESSLFLGKLGAAGSHLTVVSKPGMGVPAVTIVTKPSGHKSTISKPAIRISTGQCYRGGSRYFRTWGGGPGAV